MRLLVAAVKPLTKVLVLREVEVWATLGAAVMVALRRSVRCHVPGGVAAAAAIVCGLAMATDARAQTKGGDQVRPDTHTDADATRGDRGRLSLPSSFNEALRIARMLNDDHIVATLLARRGLMKGATDEDLAAVVRAYETTGTPQKGVEFLRERIKRFPTEVHPHVLLATLLARSGDSARAVVVWREILKRFGKGALSLDEAHAYARDLSRTGDIDGAYAVLVGLSEKAPPDAKDYWIDLGTLAWERDDDAVATLAYDKLYKLDPTTLHVAARLLALWADAGRYDDALKLALAERHRSGELQSVLFVAQLHAATSDWANVKATLDAAEKEPKPEGAPDLRQSEPFLMLRGDSSKNLGDGKGADEAYRRALGVSPTSPLVRANVLWSAIERGDTRRIRQLALAWRGASLNEEEMWAPMSVAFAKLEMVREALPFFERRVRANPRDGRVLLELADVLLMGERHALAQDLRRRAVILLRADAKKALQAKKPTLDELHVVESTAAVVRERSGNVQGEKWLAAMRASNPGFRGQEDTALDWYLATDRAGYARRLLGAMKAPGKDLRKYRLAIAMHDEDPSAVSALLAASSGFSPDERMHAAILLGDDRGAARAIGDGLAPGGTIADEPAMRQELARISYLHRPNVRATGTYLHVTGLDVVGGQASVSHDALHGRLIYSAAAVQMNDRSGFLDVPGPVNEAEGGALYRRATLRSVTEVGAAFNYQDETPIFRGALFHQRQLTKRLGLTTELRVAQRIDDTSFLRLAAARNAAVLGVRYDERRWYASAEIEGREDQTRRYQHLAWDVVASAEAGVKILAFGEPQLSVGVQAQASERDNRTDLPSSVASLVPPRADLARALPPTFQLIGGVIHLSRGDFLERYRPDRAPFPRYDCDAALGTLFPDTDTALHVLCGVSVRAPGGYTSLLAFYNRGIAGVKNNENAEVALSYTIPF